VLKKNLDICHTRAKLVKILCVVFQRNAGRGDLNQIEMGLKIKLRIPNVDHKGSRSYSPAQVSGFFLPAGVGKMDSPNTRLSLYGLRPGVPDLDVGLFFACYARAILNIKKEEV
jgi:hypothetical protein